MEFIDFRLLWEGRINRGELVRFFGISVPQASLDLARYMNLAPKNLQYDRREKVYRTTSQFRTILTSPESRAFLDQLQALATGTLSPTLSFVGNRPPYDLVQLPTRSIRPEVLIRVLWAIRDSQDIEIAYQSMRRPGPTRRWIAPHAIAFDGTRWHARAWCHENNDFRDFVFARMQKVHSTRTSEVDPRKDFRWHTYTNIVLRPKKGLTSDQRRAVEAEFGMRDGLLKIPIREALVFYLVRLAHLEHKEDVPVRGHPVEWENEAQLKPLLMEAAHK